MQVEAAGWPNEVYCELYHELNGPSEMVKQDHLKYFGFHGGTGREQLFDADPEETRNLIDDPAYARRPAAPAHPPRRPPLSALHPPATSARGGPFLPAVW